MWAWGGNGKAAQRQPESDPGTAGRKCFFTPAGRRPFGPPSWVKHEPQRRKHGFCFIPRRTAWFSLFCSCLQPLGLHILRSEKQCYEDSAWDSRPHSATLAGFAANPLLAANSSTLSVTNGSGASYSGALPQPRSRQVRTSPCATLRKLLT